LMAERVRRYRLGEVVRQDDPDAIAHGLNLILNDTAGWVDRNRPRWSDYIAVHSYERLKEQFAKLVAFP